MFPPKLILVPADFSTHSDESLKVASVMAAQFGAALLLVHVVPVIPKLPPSVSIFNEGEYEQALLKSADQRLRQMAEDISGKEGIAVTTEIGMANEAGMEILRIAEHHHADMIVIATHGMTGWHALAFGSVAEKVLKLPTCPVLVLPAKTEAPANETPETSHTVAAAH